MILILTPAICRPDMHSRVFRPVINSIFGSKQKFTWFINIDPVPLSYASVEDTKRNFLITTNGINVEINTPETPCFFNAIKWLCKKTVSYNEPIIYLEDDWILTTPFDIDDILTRHYTDFSLIGMSPNHSPSHKLSHKLRYNFNPAIWGNRLFKEFFADSILSSNVVADPEDIVMEYAKNKENELIKNDLPLPNYLRCMVRFKDKGIKWSNKIGLRKWIRSGVSDKPITYQT